jgi:hemerythrin-like metal-binding protein
MALMEWTSAFSIDIETVDAQHKKLFGYINEFYDALTEKRETKILTRLFNDLEEYTHTHFGFEEDCFKKFDYENQDAHILQHKEFIKKLAVMKKDILADKQDVEDLLEFLVNWLIYHIKGTDRMYAECFHEHGVK